MTVQDPSSIHVDEYFQHPPERVWAALTEPDLMREWLMDTDFRPEIGHRFTFQAPANPKTGFSGEVECEVLALQAHELLSISPNDAKSDTRLNWTITWTLRPRGPRHSPVPRARRIRSRQSRPAALPHDHGRRLAHRSPRQAPRTARPGTGLAPKC